MGTAVVRFSVQDGEDISWGVLEGGSIRRLSIDSDHQRDVMALYFDDRAAFSASIDSTVYDGASVVYHSPIATATQLFAQGLNYASHRAESGVSIDAEEEENLIFSKASSSLTGPNNDIVRPRGCELLDYEIELGIALKKEISSERKVSEEQLGEYIGALVMFNDVSARDFMFGAPMIQWFKGKGQRTFCPAGPVLYLLDEDDFKQLYSLELTLKLNGEVKQQAITEQLIHKPAKTLTEISEFADLNVGDCVLTGTPGGVLAGHSLKAGLSIMLNLTNDRKRRSKFTAAQKAQATFLQPGDRLELSIKSQDGTLDLGTQRNLIVDP